MKTKYIISVHKYQNPIVVTFTQMHICTLAL